jgi:hypothetical protein
MKSFLHSRDVASKGAALMIVLAFVVLLTGLAMAYMSRTTTDRQLAHSSYNDTSADLLARTALDVMVGNFKQEILNGGAVTRSNIQPQRSGDAPSIPNLIRRSIRNDPIPTPGVPSLASGVPSTSPSANGRFISLARWNSHYLIPRATPGPGQTWDTIYSDPVPSFSPPDWVLVTAQGPAPAPSPKAVIGRYAFAVYDEGGLLDMNLAGSPIWHADDPNYGWRNLAGCSTPSPTPWLVNIGRKGTVAFADLTALPAAPTTSLTQAQVDNVVGWRNYATTVRNFAGFPTATPGYGLETACTGLGRTGQDSYGSYLLYFGDPPFTIESLSDKLLASAYPFTAVPNYVSKARTDQSLTTRQALLKLRSSLGFSQNVLQYMGTFSRERNWPAPDWPNLSGHLSDGRFNMNNLALVVPNPDDCNTPHGKKKGWQTGKNRNHICGTPTEIIELFGLFWRKAGVIDPNYKTPGHWRYIPHTGPNPPGEPDPNYNSIICWDPNANRNQGRQADFFQILNYALNVGRGLTDHCGGSRANQWRTFAIGASLIDQYDSGGDCLAYTPGNWPGTGCDLDSHVVTNNGNNLKSATHTTVIEYGQGEGNTQSFGFGMEPDYSLDNTNGDCPAGQTGGGCSGAPHRPCMGDNQFPCAPGEPAAPVPPAPPANPIVISHAFSSVGDFGYGIVSPPGAGPTPSPPGSTPIPTMDFSPPGFLDAPVLDFFSYNPISSAYPRSGIVNLYTRNAPVLAAILAGTLKTDAAASLNPPSPVISGTPAANSEAMTAATRIVTETQNLLAGSPGYGPLTQTDMTRAIAARLAAAAAQRTSGNLSEQEQAISRALAEVGQTRTWNLFIDVIAQTGKYKPNAPDLTGSNFVVEGEKRYWLHISLGRDLVKIDRDLGTTPCQPGDTGCQVDVLGSQLEEVIE